MSKEMEQIAVQVHARELAKKQREISVAEFFEKNRHLLGFDNPKKALLTAVKEAVDNSLDACEEARILPEISVELLQLSESRFRMTIEDNGPGIVKQQIPKIFAKLLYGSKFHSFRQARGQQGLGISAAVMYAQLTTGKPAIITSKTDKKSKAHYYKLHIDTNRNEPHIVEEKEVDWPEKEHGTRIEIEVEGGYNKGKQSVDEYVKETAIINPHTTIIYVNPEAQQFVFSRATNELPKESREIKPHPYGVELGILQKMLNNTESRTLQAFLASEFSRVGPETAKEICENASLLPNTKPSHMAREMIEKLLEGIKKTKIIAPPTDCISPIGEELMEKGLRKEINAEFYCTVSRSPDVYRGNPFVIEVSLAYGGEQGKEEPMRLLRFANRVPLLYQQGACAVTEAVEEVNWKQYGLEQGRNSLPVGPCTLAVHMASVWVPFTSESKEAIAQYPEIIKEVKLAVQEAGRRLALYIHKKQRVLYESAKRGYIEKYIPHVSEALKELLHLKDDEKRKVEAYLKEILEKHRGELEEVGKIDNPEYDEELAKIGKEENREMPKEEMKGTNAKEGIKAKERAKEKGDEKKKEKQLTLKGK